VTREQLVSMRRYMIVLAFVAAAVLTPPDVVSQLMLAIPLILLYEITLVAIWFTDRKERKKGEAADVAAAE
jgi:sec-independent protein translocase protein TatC